MVALKLNSKREKKHTHLTRLLVCYYLWSKLVVYFWPFLIIPNSDFAFLTVRAHLAAIFQWTFCCDPNNISWVILIKLAYINLCVLYGFTLVNLICFSPHCCGIAAVVSTYFSLHLIFFCCCSPQFLKSNWIISHSCALFLIFGFLCTTLPFLLKLLSSGMKQKLYLFDFGVKK